MTNGEERDPRRHEDHEELPPLREPQSDQDALRRYERQQAPPQQGDGGSNWLWFILIFGVGNFILYKTTGFFIIPIRR